MNEYIPKLRSVYGRLEILRRGSLEFAKSFQKYSADKAIFITQANAYDTAKATIAKYFPEVVE